MHTLEQQKVVLVQPAVHLRGATYVLGTHIFVPLKSMNAVAIGVVGHVEGRAVGIDLVDADGAEVELLMAHRHKAPVVGAGAVSLAIGAHQP